MKSTNTVSARTRWGFVIAAAGLVSSGAAWAADPPPSAPLAQGETATPPAPPPAPPPPAPQPAAPPVAAVPAAAETPTVTAAPATPPPDFKKINVGVGMRVGGVFQSATDTSSLSDTGLDEIYVEPRFSGDIAPMFAWQANFQGGIPTGAPMGVSTAGSNGSGTPGVSASILDLIAKFEPDPGFHLWAGRMLVPSDRSNFSGPWFMSPWKYPGLYPSPLVAANGPLGPKQGPQGRNNGATVWGEFLGAKLKYYAGIFDLNDSGVSPLITGRVNICLLGSESGFYHSSTYYGSQDIVAVGLGAQYQKNASVNPATMAVGDLNTIIVDALGEKNFGPLGVFTAEAQYYHFDQNSAFGRKHAYYGLLSWLTPMKIGVGRLQPLVRLQQATAQVSGTPTWTMFDTYLTYVIDDYFVRVAAGYSHADMGAGTTASNAVYLGVQMQR
jgi:hypothetical protein